MTARRIVFALIVIASLTIGMYAQGGGGAAAPAQGGGGGGRRGGGGGAPATIQPGNLIQGAWGSAPVPVDSRGWGWMTKSYLSKNVRRPLYNMAKESLLNDKQVTSVTISTFNPDQYCESRKHWDYIWFEMQHSTMSFNEVQRMIGACAGPGGGAPMIRMPDALEANIQKATDLGVLGIIVPTVDDALEARDTARFSRYPPFGRRSSGAGTAAGFWTAVPGGYRETINDNFLTVVMLETLESIINADEIAATFGLDVVIQGNSDLSQFSGWTQSDDRYQQLLTISRNATLKAGKYWGNAGAAYLTGNPLSSDTRFVQNGPSRDGFAFPARGRGAAEAPEPTVGAPPEGGRRGGGGRGAQ
ncbi:MAG: aldolase/citrate lyase family protein [Vicinamibacterales bacterium]|nr:aldolase/citrate lyase family protein [Vicinamibacterales bacterium]